MARWIDNWMVDSSTGKRKYKVSYSDAGTWGCSCPAWKFNRNECRHIREVISQVGRHPVVAKQQKPLYIVDKDTNSPYYHAKTNELRIPAMIPHNRFDAEHMEIHIAYIMVENGYSIREVRSMRGHPDSFTIKHVEAQYAELGEYVGVPVEVVKKKKKRKKSSGNVRELMVIGDRNGTV